MQPDFDSAPRAVRVHRCKYVSQCRAHSCLKRATLIAEKGRYCWPDNGASLNLGGFGRMQNRYVADIGDNVKLAILRRADSGYRDRVALRVKEGAKMLGVSNSTMYEMIGKRQIGVMRLGDRRSIRIPRTEIEKLLSENLVPALGD